MFERICRKIGADSDSKRGPLNGADDETVRGKLDSRASILPTKKRHDFSPSLEDEAAGKRWLVYSTKQEPWLIFITIKQAREAGSASTFSNLVQFEE